MMHKLDDKQQQWIEDTFNSLSLKEKIGQLVCDRDHNVCKQDDLAGYLDKHPVGSVFVGAEIIDIHSDHTDKVRNNVNKIKSNSKLPVLFAGDFEHGVGSEVSGLTHMPELMGLGATFNPDLSYQYGKIIAEEAVSLDVRWVFSPVVDLNTNLHNPVTNVRAMTDDPDMAIDMLVPHIKGMQENGIAAAAKHFPGDGTDSRNQHYVTTVNTMSVEEWHQNHGRVFKSMIDSGVHSIMVGHIGFPAYEDADEATGLFAPATVSKKLMTDLLRGELGFEGVIVTDALTMCGYCSWGEYEKRILATLNAGADIFLWPDTPRFFELVLNALNDGRTSMSVIDTAVKRILRMKALLGLHEASAAPTPTSPGKLQQNYQCAVTVAEESITLLRNRKDVLPLNLTPNSRVLILTNPDNERIPDILNVFKDKFIQAGHSVTYDNFGNYKNYGEDIERFDTVILACNAKPLYGDIRAMHNNIWPFMSNHKIKNKIVVSFGSPYFIYYTASIDTYVNAYSDCKATQEVTADLIMGKRPFKGHSPVSCPYTLKLKDGIVTN